MYLLNPVSNFEATIEFYTNTSPTTLNIIIPSIWFIHTSIHVYFTLSKKRLLDFIQAGLFILSIWIYGQMLRLRPLLYEKSNLNSLCKLHFMLMIILVISTILFAIMQDVKDEEDEEHEKEE